MTFTLGSELNVGLLDATLLETFCEGLSKQCEVLFYGAMGTLYINHTNALLAAHHFHVTADDSNLLWLIASSPLSKLY